jgi:hypothetical protein
MPMDDDSEVPRGTRCSLPSSGGPLREEHARLFGGLKWARMNAGVISARRPSQAAIPDCTRCRPRGRRATQVVAEMRLYRSCWLPYSPWLRIPNARRGIGVNGDCSVTGQRQNGLVASSGRFQAGKRGIIGRVFMYDDPSHGLSDVGPSHGRRWP